MSVIYSSMTQTPSPLSAQFAALRTSVPSGPVEGYWVLNSAIELIFAALIRIFTNLEKMVELWQAGLLPTPTPRTSAARNPATTAPVPRIPHPRHPTERTRRPRAQAASVADADIPRLIPRRRWPSHRPPSRAAPPHACPRPPIRPTHGPPAPGRSKKNRFPVRSRIGYLFLYRNK